MLHLFTYYTNRGRSALFVRRTLHYVSGNCYFFRENAQPTEKDVHVSVCEVGGNFWGIVFRA